MGRVHSSDKTEPSHTARYLWPAVRAVLARRCPPPQHVFEIGCGNGATAAMLTQLGYRVTGVDCSAKAIDVARSTNRDLDLHVGSAHDDLAVRYGRYPVVVSLEVIEHWYYPYRFARTFRSLLAEAGVGIISTPYHGYWKNLALAVTGRLESYFTALWGGAHQVLVRSHADAAARGDGVPPDPDRLCGPHSATCEIDDRRNRRMTKRCGGRLVVSNRFGGRRGRLGTP